jgi:hypothetical protein
MDVVKVVVDGGPTNPSVVVADVVVSAAFCGENDDVIDGTVVCDTSHCDTKQNATTATIVFGETNRFVAIEPLLRGGLGPLVVFQKRLVGKKEDEDMPLLLLLISSQAQSLKLITVNTGN